MGGQPFEIRLHHPKYIVTTKKLTESARWSSTSSMPTNLAPFPWRQRGDGVIVFATDIRRTSWHPRVNSCKKKDRYGQQTSTNHDSCRIMMNNVDHFPWKTWVFHFEKAGAHANAGIFFQLDMIWDFGLIHGSHGSGKFPYTKWTWFEGWNAYLPQRSTKYTVDTVDECFGGSLVIAQRTKWNSWCLRLQSQNCLRGNLQRTLHLTTQMGSCKKVWHWTIIMNILMTGAVHMINIYRILMDLCIPSFFQIENYLILYIYILFYGLSGVSKKIMYFRVFHSTWRFLKFSRTPHLFSQVVPRNCGKWRTTWDSCQRVWCSRRIGSGTGESATV